MSSSGDMDLYFEILRRKTHIYCEAKESSYVLELKKIIEGILKIPPNKQILKKQIEGGAWQTLDDNSVLSECGFRQDNARAEEPACIGLVVQGEDSDLIVEPLSIPPPIPDAMRPDQTAVNEQ